MQRLYFVDFDGTITKADTTNAMTKAFAADGWQDSLRRWAGGQLSTTACAREIFRRFAVGPSELAGFLQTIPIDCTFIDFVRYVEKRRESLYILSDGYDLNISLILEKAGLAYLPYYSNHLVYTAEGWDIETPYLSACGKCGTCKKSILRSLKNDFMTDLTAPISSPEIVYIGDGLSDKCGCQEADIVFAKNHLLAYCQRQNIPCVPFSTFADVLASLQERDSANTDRSHEV